MRKSLFIAIAGAAALAGCQQRAEAPDRTVQQLMADVVQPTTEIYWNSVQYISDEEGEHEIYPRTDEEWQRVRDAAIRIGELGELLKTPGYSDGRGDDWLEFADALVEVSKLAEQAAVEQDRDKVFEVGGTIYNVCSACHQVYPPAEGIPGETG